MAGCVETISSESIVPDWSKFSSNLEEQKQEIEALQSFYENTDNLEILEEASQSTNKRYSLQLKIPIETKHSPIRVEIWLPIEKVNASSLRKPPNDDESKSSLSLKQPHLERSVSGRQAHTVIECKKLSPLQLEIVLPDTYPSESKPVYSVGAEWLNRSQLSQLSVKLNQIWEDNEGMQILFTWSQWLTDNLVDFLDLLEPPNTITLTPLNNDNQLIDLGEDDSSVHSLFMSADELIVNLLRYNYIEDMKEFQQSMHNCMVCFDEKIGREFIRLAECGHHFCEACMRDMCEMHVREGTIQLLKCPSGGECDSVVPVDVMSQLLSDVAFERWERLLLQRTLDKMEDVVYCPRCSNPIIVDSSDTHAYCLTCRIDYCKECKDVWHAGKCSTEEEKVNQRVRDLQITVEDLMRMDEAEIRRRFRNHEFVLQLKKKSDDAQNSDSVKKLLKNFVRCPDCRIPIEKLEGCNKVTCRCGCMLCYVCGQKIPGYGHFEGNAKCLLWTPQPQVSRVIERPQHEAQVRVERVLNLMPEQRRNVIGCPTCGQRNLKINRNNHIKCWLCKTNFCFECRKKIVERNVSAHYAASSKCKQHSD